ncbi:hypothetical protein B0E45_15065 [Sinorhizobium sp. A49]|nr:hypothetical protein B0E45_15065 [Sinorhizobium sp. A49]
MGGDGLASITRGTGGWPSYQRASYAVRDTPEMVAGHYGRFLPQDKAALADKILTQVWEAGMGSSVVSAIFPKT